MELDHSRHIRVGCSGWQYRHWKDDFYPPGLPASRWFAHYALSFDTVEINNSFYRLPEAATFARWRDQAPPHFLYAVKASRFLTHMKKLTDPEDPLARFFANARELGSHLGPVLYQLPPGWGVNLERFEHFLAALGDVSRRVEAELAAAGVRVHLRHAVEFRDPSWYDDRVFALLRHYSVALCLHDMEGSATGRMVVGPFIYVRFHFGTQKYGGGYTDERLEEWAAWLAGRAEDGLEIFAYFNNDTGGHAPRDAVRLRQLLQPHLQESAAPWSGRTRSS